MNVLDELQANQCESCKDKGLLNSEHIDLKWRRANSGIWPKPFQQGGIDPSTVSAVVVGQDPTINNPRAIEFVLEADSQDSNLGKFLREVFGLLPDIAYEELYFTNLVKCRFDEKPGRGNRDISEFLGQMAKNCAARFLYEELRQLEKAKYAFTLGRDTYEMTARLLGVDPAPTSQFKDAYGTPQRIESPYLNRECYLVALPHQPTYDRAKKYHPYSPGEVERRLAKIAYG